MFWGNSLGIGNGILQRILGLRLLVCRSRTYWVIVALSSCDVFYFSTQLLRGFALSDISDKPWSRASSLLPPGTCLRFLSRIGFSIPTARRFSSSVASSLKIFAGNVIMGTYCRWPSADNAPAQCQVQASVGIYRILVRMGKSTRRKFRPQQSFHKPWSRASSLPAPRYMPSIFIAHSVQHCCSSIFIECC